MPAAIEANRLASAGADHPHGRRAAVLFVVGMHDQQQVQGFDKFPVQLVRLARNGEHHSQEVLAVAQVVLRIDEGLADRFLVGVGRNRRQLGHQPVDGQSDTCLGSRGIQRILVEGAQGTDDRAEDGHRMGVTRKAVVERPHVFVQHGMPPERGAELLQLLCVGKLSMDQQIAYLDEVAGFAELLDRISAIPQYPLLAIEIGDCALSRPGVDVAFVERDQPGLGAELRDIERSLVLCSLYDRYVDRLVTKVNVGDFTHRGSLQKCDRKPSAALSSRLSGASSVPGRRRRFKRAVSQSRLVDLCRTPRVPVRAAVATSASELRTLDSRLPGRRQTV